MLSLPLVFFYSDIKMAGLELILALNFYKFVKRWKQNLVPFSVGRVLKFSLVTFCDSFSWILCEMNISMLFSLPQLVTLSEISEGREKKKSSWILSFQPLKRHRKAGVEQIN